MVRLRGHEEDTAAQVVALDVARAGLAAALDTLAAAAADEGEPDVAHLARAGARALRSRAKTRPPVAPTD